MLELTKSSNDKDGLLTPYVYWFVDQLVLSFSKKAQQNGLKVCKEHVCAWLQRGGWLLSG